MFSPAACSTTGIIDCVWEADSSLDFTGGPVGGGGGGGGGRPAPLAEVDSRS